MQRSLSVEALAAFSQSVLESAGLLESVFVTVADRFCPCGLFEL